MSQDLEKLLELVKSTSTNTKEKNKSEDNPILDFIKTYNINKGRDKIKTSLIFNIYSKEYKGKLSKTIFFKNFQKLFKSGRTKNYRYYLLDSNKFIKYDEYKLREELEEKEANKKKSREVPVLKKKC